jgi:hypothetical protein
VLASFMARYSQRNNKNWLMNSPEGPDDNSISQNSVSMMYLIILNLKEH